MNPKSCSYNSFRLRNNSEQRFLEPTFSRSEKRHERFENNCNVMQKPKIDRGSDDGRKWRNGVYDGVRSEGFPCDLCRIRLCTLNQYKLHVAGSRHLKNLNKLKLFGTVEVPSNIAALTCNICSAVTNTQEQMEIHKHGQKHLKKCSKYGLSPSQTSFPANDGGSGRKCQKLKLGATCTVTTLGSGLQDSEHMESEINNRLVKINSSNGPSASALSVESGNPLKLFKKSPNNRAEDEDEGAESDSSNESAIIDLMANTKDSATRENLYKLFMKFKARKTEEVLKPAVKEKKPRILFQCDLCHVTLHSVEEMEQHIETVTHKEKLDMYLPQSTSAPKAMSNVSKTLNK